MPRRQGDGPGHARARRKAQEATVRGPVADAVVEAHEAHAAGRRDLTGSARAFLNETALPAVRALNGAEAPTLLPAMHWIVNAIQPGLISPKAALYGHLMEWHESKWSGRPLSMAWLKEHVTALRSWASTIAGAAIRLHDHPAISPGDTRALSVDQLTPSHPDVRSPSANLNAGWLSPTGYYWIPEAWGHTSSDASGGGPCKHATSVALAADLIRTWAVAISGTVPDGEGVAASLPLRYGAHRPWVHTLDAEVILHLLRQADHERTTGVPAGAARVVNQMPLRWLRDGLCARGRHAGHQFWYVRATSHHSDALLHKADWAASQDTILQNTPRDPGHALLIVAGCGGHLDLRPPAMRSLSEVAQRAQTDQALTHRGHTPLGAAHATAYVHARDLTATATNRRAQRARGGHTPVQRRLRVRKERLSGVAVLPQPCLLCGGPEETPVHMLCGLCGECDTVSSVASTGANRCARCAQVAACPWPEPPAGPRRRTGEEALHWRIEGAHAPPHERAGPAGAALLWITVHLRDPTSVAHLLHVFVL